MTWLADAHQEWHTVNGWDRPCPLDCFDPYDNYCPDCGAPPDEACAPTCGNVLWAYMADLALVAVPVTVGPADDRVADLAREVTDLTPRDPWEPPF